MSNTSTGTMHRTRAKKQRATPKILVLGAFLSLYLFLRVLLFDVSTMLPPTIQPVVVHVDVDEQEVQQQKETIIPAIVHQPPLVPGVRGQPCRYDGHCGVGMTCAIDKLLTTMGSRGSSPVGSCQPFSLSKTRSSSTTTTTGQESNNNNYCALRCLEGLPENAQLQQVSFSKAGRNFARPDACVLTYRREPGYKRSDYDPIKFNAAMKEHRIVRRDPILNRTTTTTNTAHAKNFENSSSYPSSINHQMLWMAICYEPCNGTVVCSSTDGFWCSRNHVCRRDESYWKTSEDEMVLVTGADDTYFNALTNLVGSLRYWAPENRIAVYNLGMSASNLKTVESWDNVLQVKWKEGFPITFPHHLTLPYLYAWKPVAINESLHEYKQIFWLDAGSTVTGPITEAIRITQESGTFLVGGQDSDMKQKSHQGTYAAFGYHKEAFRGGPSYSANAQAFLYPSRYVDTVVIPNAQCAVLQDCIMPTGSTIWNHRFDQTTLSILCYREDFNIPHHTLYLAAERRQLASNLKEPSEMFIWTSRGGCLDFANQVVSSKGFGMSRKAWFLSSLRRLFHPMQGP